MESAKERNKEALKKLTAASRKAKKALEEWRQKYISKGMEPLMYGFDCEEVALIIKLLQLKLRNQQTAGVLAK